jgi:DNA invertase Pin-like site-specific DNA recombinase
MPTTAKTIPKETRWVCYYRVSTLRQGQSGLGLEAQQESVGRFVRERGGEIIAEFTETESGRKAVNRPELQQALELCRKHRATLRIAKLDRLARNLAFIAGLLETNVEFVAVDLPTKDRFMLHLQAAFAEEEAPPTQAVLQVVLHTAVFCPGPWEQHYR